MNLSQRIFYSADKHLKDSTLKMVKRNPYGTLLDLGCGDCQLTNRLSCKSGVNLIITVDSSDTRIGYSQSHNWKSIKADLNHILPIESNSVDIIHAGDVIEHLNDTDTFVKEIKRILKPDGYALISTPNLASWHNIIALIFGIQPQTCMVSDEILGLEMVEADKDMPKHRRIFTGDGLVKLFKHHGMKIIQVRGCGFYPFTFKWLAYLDLEHAAYILMKVSK
jgi:2-polyprenyl-3-methyl-5-hydroxy-6-metoxy-1,4-benzoquinol methylase